MKKNKNLKKIYENKKNNEKSDQKVTPNDLKNVQIDPKNENFQKNHVIKILLKCAQKSKFNEKFPEIKILSKIHIYKKIDTKSKFYENRI